MSSTIVTGSYRQSGTTRCLPKQGIISAQLSQIQEGLTKECEGKCDYQTKQNNGKENCVYTQLLGVYPSHVQAEHGIRVGEQVPNHSDKRQGLINTLPIQRCLDN